MLSLIILSLYGSISILNAQQCGSDCSQCTTFPQLCSLDTLNRCIWNEDLSQCEVELCGPHCSLCDGSQNEALCEDDPLCFWLVDNQMCRVKDTCASNCELCLNETACDNIGAGGNIVCFWVSGICLGGTCNTACIECTDRAGDPLTFCANSTAPPNGCHSPADGPSEACEHKTLNPTLDPTINPTKEPSLTPTKEPTKMPSEAPTNTPTKEPSITPTTTPTKAPSDEPSLSPTQAPITCGDTKQGGLNSGETTRYPLIITQDLETLIISLCDDFTNFNSTLTLSNDLGIIAFDDNGCADAVGRSQIDVNDVLSDDYALEIANINHVDLGRYRLEIECNTYNPTISPSINPTKTPTISPTNNPTQNPTISPTINPTKSPIKAPTVHPTDIPTINPTISPTMNPTEDPTNAPNVGPDEIACGDDLDGRYLPRGDEKIYSWILSFNATRININLCYEGTDFATDLKLLDTDDVSIKDDVLCPSGATYIDISEGLNKGTYTISIKGANDTIDYGIYRITVECFTIAPTKAPTIDPTNNPSFNPTKSPLNTPTMSPTNNPTNYPIMAPTMSPTNNPSYNPTITPTIRPTSNPTTNPSFTIGPTYNPTINPAVNECPDCAYNVSMITIGNVSIEECPTLAPSSTISDSSDSSSFSSASSFSSDSSYSSKSSSDSDTNPWRETSSDSDIVSNPYAFTSINTKKCISWQNMNKMFESKQVSSDDGTNQASLDLESFDSMYIKSNVWFENKCDDIYKTRRKRLLFSAHEWDTNDEFLTVVCIGYKIYDLLDNNGTDCGQVTKVFLGLCENNQTDFNSSNIDEDDLTKLIVSISPNDTSQITNVEGRKRENNDLGIVVEFAANHNVDEFELCLANVTVDSEFNQEKDSIDIGNGTVYITDIINNETSHECRADGLPCLNFAFDDKCPKCQCEGGIQSLTMKHESDCKALSIMLYYDLENELHLCSFSNVQSGAIVSCTPYLYDLYNEMTYIRIVYDDDDDDCVVYDNQVVNIKERRRRMRDNSDDDSDSESSDDDTNAECIDSFVTDCSVNLIGKTSDGCGVLKVVSFIDGENVRCYDDTIVNENVHKMDINTFRDAEKHQFNALLNGEERFKDVLQTFVEFDPFIRWILIAIFMTFIGLMMIAVYICIIHRFVKRNLIYAHKHKKQEQFQAKRHRLKSMDDDEDEDDDASFENEFYNETDIESIMSPKDADHDCNETEMGRTTSN